RRLERRVRADRPAVRVLLRPGLVRTPSSRSRPAPRSLPRVARSTPRVGRRRPCRSRAPRAAVQLNLQVPARALAIAAHPDDTEFGCGATLAKWSAAGCVVNHLVCTDGSKGSWDPTTDVDALVATRQDEQRAAAKALGATGEVTFLGEVDGELE